MARRSQPNKVGQQLSQAEMQLLEGLADRGALIVVPANRNAKPRKVAVVSLAEGGRAALLYLAKRPAAEVSEKSV